MEFVTEKKNSARKCSWGLKTQKNKKFLLKFFFKDVPGVLKRMQKKTVKILERSGLAVKSYHPETLAAEEEKKNKKF